MNKLSNLTETLPIPIETIERRIYLIRGTKVMLDNDLAELYQVETKRLNEQVRRNFDRFPADFMFQLNQQEIDNLRFQIGTPNMRSQFATASKRNVRFSPYAFTEQGVAMLSSALNSKRAIAVNIAIMRAFVKLRQVMSTNKTLTKEMEKFETGQKRLQLDVAVIFHVIKKLIKEKAKPQIPREKIGFRT
jgi:hypothetical protein